LPAPAQVDGSRSRHLKEAFAAKDARHQHIGQHYTTSTLAGMRRAAAARSCRQVNGHGRQDLGGFDKMRTDFVQAGVTQFGSGWVGGCQGRQAVVAKTANGETR